MWDVFPGMEKQLICDNASSMGPGISLYPQCWKGIAKYICTVRYDELSTEEDTFKLCEECRKNLIRDARRYGYKVRCRRL